MIAYDLQVSGNGALTINPDVPPGRPPAAAGSAARAGLGPADVHSAAINAFISAGGSRVPGSLTDQEAMDEVAVSLAGNAGLFNGAAGGSKKKAI